MIKLLPDSESMSCLPPSKTNVLSFVFCVLRTNCSKKQTIKILCPTIAFSLCLHLAVFCSFSLKHTAVDHYNWIVLRYRWVFCQGPEHAANVQRPLVMLLTGQLQSQSSAHTCTSTQSKSNPTKWRLGTHSSSKSRRAFTEMLPSTASSHFSSSNLFVL